MRSLRFYLVVMAVVLMAMFVNIHIASASSDPLNRISLCANTKGHVCATYTPIRVSNLDFELGLTVNKGSNHAVGYEPIAGLGVNIKGTNADLFVYSAWQSNLIGNKSTTQKNNFGPLNIGISVHF